MSSKKRQSKPKSKGSSRREFLLNTGKAALFFQAFDTVFSSIVNEHAGRAFAQTTGQIKSLIHLNAWASPPRWMFDAFLNPTNSTTGMVRSPMVSNIYTGPSTHYNGVDYQLVRYLTTNTFIPYLWNLDIPTVGGPDVKAMSILDNWLNIRGINVLNGGHVGANQLHQQGVVAAPTFSSLTADRAASVAGSPEINVMPAVTLNATIEQIYRSAKGTIPFRYDVKQSVNNLSALFASLKRMTAPEFNSTFLNNRDALEARMNSTMAALGPGAGAYYANLVDSNSRALKILNDDTVTTFAQLSTEWPALYDKYMNLIDRILGNGTIPMKVYPKINDRRIGEVVNASSPNFLHYQYVTGVATQNMVGGNVDLRSFFDGSDRSILAGQFATIEFLASRRISPSITVNIASIQKILVNGVRNTMVLDQHVAGCMVGVFINTMYHLSFTACLYELIRVLKAANLFNSTLIYYASEFNRSARRNGSGSDHGPGAAHVNLISGRIPDFKIIGNILTDSAGVGRPESVDYKGCWGVGGGFPRAIDPQLTIIDVWGSVMRGLGLPLSELPNAVDKSRLLFPGDGNFTVKSQFDVALNIPVASKAG